MVAFTVPIMVNNFILFYQHVQYRKVRQLVYVIKLLAFELGRNLHLRLVHTVRCTTAICYIRKWNVASDLVILFTRRNECGCYWQCTYIGIAHHNHTEWVWNLIMYNIEHTSASHAHEIAPYEHPH